MSETRAAAPGQASAAADAWRKAVEADPGSAETHFWLGRDLLAAGRASDALPSLREAVRLRPGYGEALNALGCTLRQLGQIAEASAAFAAAVRANGAVAEWHGNLGSAFYELGRLPEAVAEHDRAVRLRPGDANAHFNLSLALLGSGRWDRGWVEYEWRRKALNCPSEKLDVPQPPWTGWDPAGATLLVVCEQGLGDTLQFIRYVPLLADAGAKVVVEAQPPLKQLLRGVRGVGRVVAREDPLPAFDAHVKVMSLPAILGTRPHNVPCDVPYVRPDPDREAVWARRLTSTGPGFKVGICWQGSGTTHFGGLRTLPLAAFEPLARVPGVRLFSLQKHVGTDQLSKIAGKFAVETFDPPLDPDPDGAFMDTAAVVRHLDLVVTCDTSVCHLAGAVGARTWIALPAASDWRWMRERDDSPWYPTVRLFRQRTHNDWDELCTRMATALAELVSTAKPTEPPAPQAAEPHRLLAPVAPGELLDRISILEIKARRISDPGKLTPIRAELAALSAVREAGLPHTPELGRLAVELRRVNEELWQIEDAIRAAEANNDFGAGFVTLARRIYRVNDRRADLKRQASGLLGSPIADQKQYAAITPPKRPAPPKTPPPR